MTTKDNPIERIGWARLGWVVGLVLFVGLGVQAIVKHDAEWAQVFVAAARQLWRGEDFYAAGTLYLYPPFGALVGLLFAPLPEWAVRLAWYLVDVAAVIVLAVAAWRLSGGGALEAPSRRTRDDWTIVALGAVVAVPFAWNTLLHQQADLVVDALVALGALMALRRRPLLAGVLIGLGAAFKGPPLLFVVYFLWRRDWLAALALVATAVGVNLLPDLVARAPEGGTWVGLWLTRWVLPATGVDTALGSWGTALIFNQSLSGTVQRLANTVLVAGDGGLVVTAATTLIETRPLKAITYGLMGLIGLATFVASILGDVGRRDGTPAAETTARATELAIVPLLMLLFSPMSGLAHFPVVALPALILARRAVSTRDPRAALPLGVAVVMAILVNKDLVGATIYDAVLWSGAATIAALALWFGCVLVLARGENRPA